MSNLKENSWYYIPSQNDRTDIIGFLGKIIRLKQNENYADVEQWAVKSNRTFEEQGIIADFDTVIISKHGRTIAPPPMGFQVLHSKTVKQILDSEQDFDTED